PRVARDRRPGSLRHGDHGRPSDPPISRPADRRRQASHRADARAGRPRFRPGHRRPKDPVGRPRMGKWSGRSRRPHGPRVLRARGPGYRPGGAWWRDARYRVEADRGLNDREDLWFAGTFAADLRPGEEADVTAWADDLSNPPPPARSIVQAARSRAREMASAA